MTLVESILLGLVQGLTEFLPVSSSGHLALGEKLLGFEGEASVTFDVLVHLATLLAILIVIAGDVVRVLRKERRLLVHLFVGTLPAVAVGLFLRKHMVAIKTNLLLVGLFFLATALILVLAHRFRRDRKGMAELTLLEALAIGAAQALAILPGISRSGSTISAARVLGLEPRAAFSFSFLLGAVAILGAMVLDVRGLESLGGQLGAGKLAAAFVAALVSGVGALLLFRRMVVAGQLHRFAWYLVPLGLVTIALHFR